ncbi:hypothetical protein ACFWDQ_01585 [Streptomyces sp. NPDC060053]|uniref:hypothetical protein n=1 Tax=Streptomyces sp. NPDC060053 TaxID=3347047 RepID=UPI00367CA81C
MPQVTQNRVDITATVMSLAAEAADLQTRVDELRQEIVSLDERMSAISAALGRCPDV